jgi:hypothetical protein
MQEYKNDPQAFAEVQKKMIMTSAPILLIAGFGGLFIAVSNTAKSEPNLNTLPFTIPFILLLLSYSMYKAIKRAKMLFLSYTLSIDDNTISRQQLNTSFISIRRDDVMSIGKASNGNILIKGKSAQDLIIITKYISDYSLLEQRLNSIKEVDQKLSQPFMEKYRIVVSLFTVGLMAVVYLSFNKILVAASAVILIGMLIWGFYTMQINKNIDKKIKSRMWIVVIVIASIIGVTIMKLTATTGSL